MKKEKSVYKKIRKVWAINPRTRVKEDKTDIQDLCKQCHYCDPDICADCPMGAG